VKIEYLCENMRFVNSAAEGIYREFITSTPDTRTYEQVLETVRNCGKTELPIRLIAVVDDKCAGMVSLVDSDLIGKCYTPWLALLFVNVQHRGRGTGRQLIERVKDIAADMGYGELYLRTEHAGKYYEKLGWQYIESGIDELGLHTDIYKTGLCPQ
jgi:N-acetylglutamate synthase and related acetyltransferases